MTTLRLRHWLSPLLAVAMLLTMTALPASAVAVGSAEVLQDGPLYPGDDEQVTVRVTNAGMGDGLPLIGNAASPIDAVQVFVPAQAVEVGPGDVAAPMGWTLFDYDEQLDIAYFFAADGSELQEGESVDFGFTVDVLPRRNDSNPDNPLDDTRFLVQVSDDGGLTSTNAGNPPLDIDVLRVLPATIVKPADLLALAGGIADPDPLVVTSGQTTADVTLSVENLSTEEKVITLDAVDDANPMAMGRISVDEQVVTVASGDTGIATADATFGNAGTLVIRSTADSADGDQSVPARSDEVTLEQAATLSYANDTFAPRFARTDGPQTFTFDVNKTGVPAVRTFSTLSFTPQDAPDAQPADGTADVTLGRDAVNGQQVSVGVDLTAPADFTEFDVSLDLTNGPATRDGDPVAVDANGAYVNAGPVDLGQFIIDRLGPLLENLLAIPEENAVETGEDDASTDGWTVDVTGTATVRDGEPCGDCVVTSVALNETLDNGTSNTIQLDPADFTIAADGSLSGSYAVDHTGTAALPGAHEGAYAVSATLVVALESGRGVPSPAAAAPPYAVDLVLPELVDAETGRDDAGDFILVELTEPVGQLSTNPLDWRIDDNAVTAVNPIPSADATVRYRLDLAQPNPDDTTGFTGDYMPLLPVTRAFDRVELDLVDQAFDIVDGIVPGVVELLSVTVDDADEPEGTAYGPQGEDDEFFTNDASPTINVDGLAAGGVLEVTVNGATTTFDNGEGGEGSFPITLGAGDGAYTVTLRQLDGAGNPGEALEFVIELDRFLPALASFNDNGDGTVTVTFSEAVPRGRDAAFDWTVFQNGRNRPIASVSGSGTTRTLTLDPAAFQMGQPVENVSYVLRTADEQQRYEDRASNELGDMRSFAG